MTAEAFTFEPEVEAILLEVARDPNSILFRVPRKAVVPTLLEDRPSFTSHTAALTAAEREIVRVHRAEVAWLLRQVCLRELIEAPRGARFVSPYRAPEDECKTLSVAQMGHRVKELRKADSLEGQCRDGLDLVGRFLDGVSPRRISVVELASASYRLHPTHGTRNLAALDLVQCNSPRAALRLYSKVLEHYPNPQEYERSCEGIGFVFHTLGDLSRSIECYAMACRDEAPHTHAYINRLILALRLGRCDEAVECSRRLDEILAPDHAFVDWYRSVIVDWVRSLSGEPPKAVEQVVRQCGAHFGGVAWRIANAFA